MSQEHINNLDRYLMSNEIEAIIKNLPTMKIPGLDEFTTESLNL
jgi:hypothetical protein